MESLDIKFGKYTLIQKVGDGGMAEVYKALVDGVAGFQKVVAIKKIHPSLSSNERFQKNFVNEARLCGQLHHHNVVEVYEFDRVQDALYLAMEFIDGINLEQLGDDLRSRQLKLPNNIIVSIMVQAMEGLAYAHTAAGLDKAPLKVIHRDLKPSNILIDHLGVVKIVDFGVAKADMNRYATQEMTAKGTASYMAPEQVLGKKKLTFAVDIFSAGAILFELLTDERLFDGDHVFAILKQVATSDINDILNRIPKQGQIFSPVLKMMLTKEPEDRSNATELLKAFKAIGLPRVGTRPLSDYIDRLEEELEEGQQTIIDIGGMSSAMSPPPVIESHEEDLFETGPTRVAFMPEPPKRTALGPDGLSAIQTAIPSSNQGRHRDLSLDDDFDDNIPTRMTGPTLVQRSLFDIRETTQDRVQNPSRQETTNTNPYPRQKESVNLVKRTPAKDAPKRTPSHQGSDIGQKTVVFTEAERIAALSGRSTTSQNPPRQNKASAAFDDSSFKMATSEGEKAPNHLIRALIAMFVLLAVGGVYVSTLLQEHEVTIDFTSPYDPAPDQSNTNNQKSQEGVEIRIDGDIKGRTFFSHYVTFKGPSKTLFVEARKSGYHSETRNIELLDPEEKVRTVNFELIPLPQTLRVMSSPPGAMIYVDSESLGTLTPANIDLSSEGSHVIRLEKSGYTPVEERIEIAPGSAPPPLSFKLRPFTP